jgi:hypothetical protein
VTDTTEEWRTVEGFPDYAVSSHGQVMRTASRSNARAGQVLKQQTLHGYRYVNLSKGGAVSACRVHRLVCIAFHGPAPSEKHHAAHNDGDRANNFFRNLRWATPSENMMDKHLHGTMPIGDANGARRKPDRLARGLRNGKHTKPERTPRGEAHHSAKLTAPEVLAIRKDTRPQRAIAAAYGVSKCAIAGIKAGKTWGHIA